MPNYIQFARWRIVPDILFFYKVQAYEDRRPLAAASDHKIIDRDAILPPPAYREFFNRRSDRPQPWHRAFLLDGDSNICNSPKQEFVTRGIVVLQLKNKCRMVCKMGILNGLKCIRIANNGILNSNPIISVPNHILRSKVRRDERSIVEAERN